MAEKQPEETTKPKIRQQARRIVNVDGPVTICGSTVFNTAGEVVARVGIDQDDDE